MAARFGNYLVALGAIVLGAAEWITALVEAGRAEEACAACTSTAKHLVSLARPTRQIALLRLTVARALAESSSPGAFEALEQAASDARRRFRGDPSLALLGRAR